MKTRLRKAPFNVAVPGESNQTKFNFGGDKPKVQQWASTEQMPLLLALQEIRDILKRIEQKLP